MTNPTSSNISSHLQLSPSPLACIVISSYLWTNQRDQRYRSETVYSSCSKGPPSLTDIYLHSHRFVS